VCLQYQFRDLEQLAEEAAGLRLAAEDLADLADHDRQRDAVEQTNEDRPGEEIRQGAEAQEAGGNTEDAGEQRQGDAEREVEAAVAGRQRRDDGSDHGAGGGIGADDHLSRGTGERIDDHRQDRRIEARRGAQPRHFGVGDGHRNRHGGDCQSGAEVVWQSAARYLSRGCSPGSRRFR
jgi:hypothetical protein